MNALHAQEQFFELTGQVFFKNSDEPVSAVDVLVDGTSRATETNENGSFSIVVRPNEKLIFSGSGLITNYYIVPSTVEGKFYTMKHYIDVDTTQYKEVIVRKFLTKEEFDFLMKYGYIPDPNLVASRQNMNENNLQSFLQRAPRTYYENQLMIIQQLNSKHGTNYGQTQQFGGINPLSWYDFFKNWKKNTKNSN